MGQVEFVQVAGLSTAFHQEFAPFFGRKEARRRGEHYLRGVLVQQMDWRNAENVAETIEGATVSLSWREGGYIQGGWNRVNGRNDAVRWWAVEQGMP